MHEMTLMGGVFEAIERTVSQHEVKRVLKVKIKVGELTNAVPEALQMAFEAFSKGTVCEGAELVVERIAVLARCRKCLLEFEIKGLFFFCPACQNVSVELIQGEELLLESLEVEIEENMEGE